MEKEDGNRKKLYSRLHQAGAAGRGVILAQHTDFFWRHKSSFPFCIFLKGVMPSIISKNLSNFHKQLLRSACQLADLHGHLNKMEAFHLPRFLLRSSIAQRESDCQRSVQFALVMRQLDRDTTAVILPDVQCDSLIRIGCIFQLNHPGVYHILIFCLTALNWVYSFSDGAQALCKDSTKQTVATSQPMSGKVKV